MRFSNIAISKYICVDSNINNDMSKIKAVPFVRILIMHPLER